MNSYIEDIIKFIETIVILFSLPYAYIESYNTKFDKLLITIEEIGNIVLMRIANKFVISKYEINSLIKSELLKSKLNNNIININDIKDYLIRQIETNPFISQIDRRKSLESIIKIAEENKLNKVRYYRWISSYRKNIYTVILIIIVVISLFSKQYWSIFIKLGITSDLTQMILIGIGLFVLLFIFFKLVWYIIGTSKVNLGEPCLKNESFNYLPNYYNEYLDFKATDKNLKLTLYDVKLDTSKKVVESDPKFFSFGIYEMYKTLNTYSLKFNSDNELELEISITKKSVVNGIYDLDLLNYKLKYRGISKKYSIIIEFDKDDKFSSLINFIELENKFGLIKGFIGEENEELNIVLDNNKKLYAILLNSECYILEPALK